MLNFLAHYWLIFILTSFTFYFITVLHHVLQMKKMAKQMGQYHTFRSIDEASEAFTGGLVLFIIGACLATVVGFFGIVGLIVDILRMFKH